MNGNMRTIRWAHEVWTATGIVDVIRFEDYIVGTESVYMCRMGECIKGKVFSDTGCVGCVHKVFRPTNQLGILTTCFEVKITVSDFKSPNGHNFHGNKNYYVVPVEIVDKVLPLVSEGIGLIKFYPKSSHMVVVKECEFREVDPEELNWLLYNAMKKWM